MILLDYIIIIIISISSLLGLIRGFIKETLACITWIFAIFCASHYYTHFANYFTCFSSTLMRNSFAIVSLFTLVLISGGIISHVISWMVRKIGLSSLNRILGFGFGALRGLIVVIIIIFLLEKYVDVTNTTHWQQSQIIFKIHTMIHRGFNYLKTYHTAR